MRVLKVFILGFLALQLSACGGSKNKNTDGLVDGQGSDAQKAQEQREKQNASRRKMLIEGQSVRVVEYTDNVLILRSMLRMNKVRRSMIYSTDINKALPEQEDIQDMTSEIQGNFPGHNLEIASYKFKAGSIDVMAVEYRFMKFTDKSEESASQFVLVILDKSLGDKAMVKSLFEYPSKSSLKSWAKKMSKDSIETKVEPRCTENCL